MQVNLHHCSDASDALVQYVLSNNIDLVLCQDIYVSDDAAPGIPPDWPIYFSLRYNSAIIITNRDYAVISNLALDNSITISLNVNDDVIFICSQYSPPNNDINKDFMDLGTHFNKFDKILIAGDFNVPIMDLGYARQTERTEIFLEHLVEKQLRIMNDVTAPHSFVQGTRKGRPDLTLGGLEICDKLNNWFVDDKIFSYSDHRYIRFSLNYTPIIRLRQRFKTKNKSFRKFIEDIRKFEKNWLQDLILIKNTSDLDDHVEDFMKIVTEMSEKHFRKGTLSYKPTIKWFSEKLRSARNKVSAHYKRYIRNPEDVNLKEIYVKHRREYKKLVKKAKRDSWTNFCHDTSDTYGTLYKYITGKTTKPSDFIFTRFDNSTPFDSYDDVAKDLMKEHFSVDKIPTEIFNFTSTGKVAGDVMEVTTREMRYAMSCQKNNKAPGYDEIDALIVKNICKACPSYVRKLFTTCFRFGHFPRIWKNGLVIFFRKRNKDGKSARSFRPITLLSIFGKLLERIIKIRTMPLLESIGFWDEAQYGFREKRSTVTAIHFLRELIRDKLRSNKYYAITSIDIQAAFDAVDWMTLAEIIDGLPISDYLKRILKNYISNRRIGFSFTNGIIWFALFKGCPQGSCLGPLLWLIVADYLLKKYKIKFEEILSYADDFVIFAGADTRAELERNMNDRIKWFAEISNELKLTISREKCMGMLFGRYLLENRHPIFKIDNISIPIKDTITYLGLTLDAKFNWISHLENIREKIRDLASNIKKTDRRDRGLQANFRKIWYKTVIEKQIVYGAEVWFRDLKENALSKLSSCQRLGLLTILSTYRTVSTDALCVLNGIPPLHISLRYLVKKYDIMIGKDTIKYEDVVIKRQNIMINLATSDFPKYTAMHNLQITDKSDDDIKEQKVPIVYTDGSKMITGVGAAYTVYLYGEFIEDFKISLNKMNSIYQAELIAIKYAINWFLDTDYKKVYIYTDNKSSTLALQRNFPANLIIKEIYTNLIQHPDKIVIIGWTRAHVGTLGNERADTLAKEAINRENANITENVPFPVTLIKRICKINTVKDWQREWRKSGKGRDTYTVLNRVDENFVCSGQLLQYFITAHGSFPEYLKKIGKRNSDLCDCGYKGNVRHYLFGRCPKMPYFFYFNNSLTVRQNISRVLFCKENYRKLCANYNVLNELYSFIRYKF